VTTTPTSPADLINQAADLIEQVGMCGDDVWPGAGPYVIGDPVCCIGAMRVVLGETKRGKTSEDNASLIGRTTKIIENRVNQVVNVWSDRHDDDPEYVVSVLRRIAAKL
jgi:hypothetical protein